MPVLVETGALRVVLALALDSGLVCDPAAGDWGQGRWSQSTLVSASPQTSRWRTAQSHSRV